jgi:hypothetical protein
MPTLTAFPGGSGVKKFICISSIFVVGFIVGCFYIINFGQIFDTGAKVGYNQAFSDIKGAMKQAEKDNQVAFEMHGITFYLTDEPELNGVAIARAGADSHEE